MTAIPTVTIAVPALNEAEHIVECLDAIAAQTHSTIVQVLVIDGGSSDRTRELATAAGATVLDNPHRIQAAALNIALDAAKGDVFVRVDARTVIDADYVANCVRVLDHTGAAMVGGAMSPVANGWRHRGIAAAMASRVGAGPARFHIGGAPGWVDTVYLGAYRAEDAREVGGYAAEFAVNEDAEFAFRMKSRGGVWFDPSIRSTYTPRPDFVALGRQFFRYGRGRAATVRRHPGSLSPRQLAAPLLVLALLSPWRRPAALVYAGVVVASTAGVARREGSAAAGFACALPVMHCSWGAGFLLGLAGYRRTTPPT